MNPRTLLNTVLKLKGSPFESSIVGAISTSRPTHTAKPAQCIRPELRPPQVTVPQ